MDFEGFTLFKTDIIIYYLMEFENYLEQKSTEVENKILEWQNSSKEKEYSAFDYYENDFLNYTVYYKQLKLESVFLSSYASFEHYLKNMTKLYKEYFELKIGVDDLSGRNYILKSKKYLEKVIDLNLTGTEKNWNLITKYQFVRNKIVHNNSNVGEQSADFINQIEQMDGISISDGKIILTNKDFIISFWKLVDSYTSKIFQVTRNKITTANLGRV